MRISKHKHFLLPALFLGVGLIALSVPKVFSISKACQNSPECLAAVEREREASKKASLASESANLYQTRVEELNLEIASQISAIAETEANIEDLTKEIKKTEVKLSAQQLALAKIMRDMHFDNSKDAITVLAGSGSVSDLAERQSREAVAKQQITVSASAIKKMKEKLEADKVSIENLLKQQQSAKANLETARHQQQQLVEKYKNNAEAYAKAANAAREAQRRAEEAEQLAHPERYKGTVFTGANTYPWQGDCPARQDEYTTFVEVAPGDKRKIGGYVCECVSYVGWKAYEKRGIIAAWGHAYSWADAARARGYRVDHIPAPDTIGQIGGAPFGHVFWVESVNADGSINVTEYNNAYATKLYSGYWRFGDFGARTISASEARKYNFIHF